MIFLLSIFLLIPALAFGQDDSRVLKPIIEVGDRWTYRGTNMLGPGVEEYDIQVASVHDDLVQVVCTRKRDGKEFDGTYTSEWSSSTICSGFISVPPQRIFQFPLLVGNSHAVSFTIRRPRMHQFVQKVEGNVIVKGWEFVEVPAGRFRAMKVEAEMTASMPDGGIARRISTYWYSPEVRRSVKLRSTVDRGDTFEEELLAFKLVE